MSAVMKFKPRRRPPTPARHPFTLPEGLHRQAERAKEGLSESFKGVTSDGQIVPGLYSIQRTGVSTQPILEAAEAFLACLTPEQRRQACFDLEAKEWRQWSNVHPFLMRHGQLIEELDERQRELALGLPGATLSAGGYQLARDVMRLNEYIGYVCGGKWDEYGEWLYWLSIFGEPTATEPWGWQIDGHHLIVNCFVLGDQIVISPTFFGSEPVAADEGKWAGIRVFAEEEARGLALMRSLDSSQQAQASLGAELPGEVTAAFRDNAVVPYSGLRCADMTADQRQRLSDLIHVYVDRDRPGHAALRFREIEQHLDETYFAWAGACDEDAVFYYRIHSPVVLIEFDHQRGIALDNDEPSRHHIHTVVRTPNGNDYGKDLLRLHYQTHHRR
ncbi:MAG TPA: DUF3500 domain-containing protein [Chloroflexota bacterium]